MKERYYFWAAAVLFAISAVLCGAFVVSGAAVLAAAGLVTLVYGYVNMRRGKKGDPSGRKGRNIAEMIVIGAVCVYILFCDLGAWSSIKEFYPFHRAYSFSEKDLWDILPESIEKDAADYRYDHMPSVMQGTGHTSIRYTGSKPYTMDREAVTAFMLCDYSESADLSKELDRDNVVIFYDRDFWKGHESTARVYVTYVSGNVNHPHSMAVIADSTSGRVEFARLG